MSARLRSGWACWRERINDLPYGSRISDVLEHVCSVPHRSRIYDGAPWAIISLLHFTVCSVYWLHLVGPLHSFCGIIQNCSLYVFRVQSHGLCNFTMKTRCQGWVQSPNNERVWVESTFSHCRFTLIFPESREAGSCLFLQARDQESTPGENTRWLQQALRSLKSCDDLMEVVISEHIILGFLRNIEKAVSQIVSYSCSSYSSW